MAIGSAAMLALGVTTGAVLFPVEKEVIKTVQGPVEVVTVTETVEVPGPVQLVNVTKYVDNGKLADLEKAIYENEGDLEFVTDGLDDDETHLITERVFALMEMRMLAEKAAREELKDLVDKEVVGTVTLDEDEIRNVEVEESTHSGVDFKDRDAEFSVELVFTQDGKDYKAVLEVAVRDNKVRTHSIDLVSVELDE